MKYRVKKQAVFVMVMMALSASAIAMSLDQQRIMYQNVMKKLDKNASDPALQPQINALKSYPLYPYMAYKFMSENLSTTNDKDVQKFLAEYPTFGMAQNLRSAFSNELIKRGQWQSLTTLLKSSDSVADKCHYHYARWMLGHQKESNIAAKDIWLSASDRPAACNALFDVWRNSQPLTTDTILLRLGMTIEAKNTKLARYVLNLLPESESLLKTRISNVLDDPEKLPEFAKFMKPSGFSHQVVHAIFPQFVRKNVTAAQSALPQIVKYQKISKQDKIELEKSIAAFLIRDDITPTQYAWRDNFIRQSNDGDLIEKRMRFDLSRGDFQDLDKWLAALPPETKQKEEWVYWQANSLIAKGQKKKGEELLRSILSIRGYYPMLSAQRLNVAYPIKQIHDQTKTDKTFANSLAKDKNIARIRELLYWNQLPNAMREWRNLLDHQNTGKIAAYANYAKNQNWAVLSVQATIMGKLWNNFDERFPLVYSSLFKSALKDKSISHSYAIAIARQESALHPEVMSPAGARGLMQLMPATAKEVARKIQMQNYSQTQQLLEPSTNIQLGTSYLESMYQQFDNNRILSSAAYNAGPGRVKQWLKRSNGSLSVDAFVESIPFNETRNYVKNVLMYDYIYRYIMGEKPKTLFTSTELNRQY